MSVIENLFDEDILLPNLKGISFFILIYEHFEDVVISTVKEFYSSPCVLDGQLYCSIDDQYINALKKIIDDQEDDAAVLYKISLIQATHDRERYRNEIVNSRKMQDDYRDGKNFEALCIG